MTATGTAMARVLKKFLDRKIAARLPRHRPRQIECTIIPNKADFTGSSISRATGQLATRGALAAANWRGWHLAGRLKPFIDSVASVRFGSVRVDIRPGRGRDRSVACSPDRPGSIVLVTPTENNRCSRDCPGNRLGTADPDTDHPDMAVPDMAVPVDRAVPGLAVVSRAGSHRECLGVVELG